MICCTLSRTFSSRVIDDIVSKFFQVVTDIIYLHGQKLTTYKGNYDTFERTREEQLKVQQRAVEANEKSRSHMQVRLSKLSAIF